jgi:hypothetical protein
VVVTESGDSQIFGAAGALREPLYKRREGDGTGLVGAGWDDFQRVAAKLFSDLFERRGIASGSLRPGSAIGERIRDGTIVYQEGGGFKSADESQAHGEKQRLGGGFIPAGLPQKAGTVGQDTSTVISNDDTSPGGARLGKRKDGGDVDATTDTGGALAEAAQRLLGEALRAALAVAGVLWRPARSFG